jgi:hypothetical protein
MTRQSVLGIVLLWGILDVPAQQANRHVLSDYRIDGLQEGVRSGTELSPKNQRAVLTGLFPKYLTATSGCGPEPVQPVLERLDAERSAGLMVPSIEEFAEGSFTAPDRHQTAYFVKVGECFAETRNYFGTYRLATFEGSQLVANVQPLVRYGGALKLQANGLSAAADVNNDGLHELLLESITLGGGVVEVIAWLVSLRDTRLHIIKEFDEVYLNQCSAGMTAPPPVLASVITYGPPQLFVEQYEAECNGTEGLLPALRDFRRQQSGKPRSKHY